MICALVLVGLSFTSTLSGQTPTDRNKRALPEYDIRDSKTTEAINNDRVQADALVERRRANLESFMASAEQIRRGTRIVPNTYGLPKLYMRERGSLSGASALKPVEIAKSFLQAQPEVFSLNARDIDRLRLVVEDVSGNAQFLSFNQTLNGIDVFNGQIKFTLNKDGEIIQVATGDIVPGLNLTTSPRLAPEDAVKAAFIGGIGEQVSKALSPIPDTNGKAAFLNPHGNSYSPVTAELSIFPMTASSARLAYRIFLEVDAKSWYEILIDANDGTLLFRHNLYVFAGQARIWTESPLKGTRTLFSFPDPSNTNPEGWLPATATVTTGNNVDAYLDANGNDVPDATNDPNMSNGRAFSANQVFDFPFGDGTVQADPRGFQPAAVTNIFYFVNTAHDYYYSIGFTEAAGNFQTNNFGKGGTGNDAVLAEAQQGLSPNNASFAPTPEGRAPRMRLGIFTMSTATRSDDLDADYDGMVVIHEYGHGVSNRLVGGTTSTSCLNKIQSGAMGEGWSDYFASSLFDNPIQGAYISGDATRGLRRYSYESYPFTYEDVGNGVFGYEVHDDGEIWAATLWDLRKSLGAAVTDRLVINGLKATPCNPSMTDARDAIIVADQATNNGANRTTIWTVFARHGLGYSAVGVEGTPFSGTRYDAAYDLPPDLQTTRNPTISSNPLSIRTGLGDSYRYNIAATNPEAGTLTYVLSNGPSGMAVASNGTVTWTAAFVSPRVKITVTDGKGGKLVHGYALPVVTALNDGRTVTIAGNQGTTGFATITVPAGVPVLQIKLRGGAGDPDLFVTNPSNGFFMSVQDGSNETLSFANPRPGDWLIEVDAFETYSAVSLTASFITPTLLSGNTTLTGLAGDFTSESFYRIPIPAGATSFSIVTSGGTGDVDIFLRKDFPAVCQPFAEVLMECLRDRSSVNDGTAELISLTNPAPGDYYLDVVGYIAYSGVKMEITTTFPPLTLTTTGTATTSTPGTSPNLAVGYATATVNSGTNPYATAVFGLTQNGYIVSEAGVPASPPVQSARIFMDYRTGVATSSGPIDIFTGLAIANRGTATATLTYTLRDRGGQLLATGQGSLAAGAHVAKFLHELRIIAPNFNLPANFSTVILYGSLEISSSQPVSVLGLRLTTNQRKETLLTSTAIADLSQPLTNTSLYFPQIADGGGYTTTIILTNTSSATQSGTISIFNDDGAAQSVRPVGGTAGSSFPYSIPASGTFVFQTDGSPSITAAGWAKVTPSSGNMSPVGAAVFSYTPAGILVTESGVPASLPTTRARLYVDWSKGHDTGLALGNPGSGPISITVQAFQANGNSAGSGPVTVNVPANGHAAKFAGELISGLPDGFTGVADLTSSSPFVPLTLRSLNNGRGDFLLTTFPAADLNQSAPTPIVFPQIADGAGYTTQFILISAGGIASVNVNFIGDDGLPVAIGRTP